MKNRIFAALSMLTSLTAAAAFAQSSVVMHADIPFEFRVGTTVLPSGHYEVRPELLRGVLSIACRECKAGAMIQTDVIQGKSPEVGTLVFHRYGETYYLSTVWTPGYSQGRELHMSKQERELAGANPPAAVTQVAHTRR